MRFELNVDYPLEKMALSRQRMEARPHFRYIDRVPVNYCIVARYFAPLFGLRYIDFFKDAETQYYWQLQFAKYQIENIPCDYCTEPVINVHPYFDNAIPPSAQGAEIGLDGRPAYPRPAGDPYRGADGALCGRGTGCRSARQGHRLVAGNAPAGC